MPYINDQDKIDRHVNGFATQSFRDQADRDYIAARLSCRSELMPQFLWASQQAVEKYLKAILLYNRIRVPKLTHDVAALLALTTQIPTVPFSIGLSKRSRKFIDHLAMYGQNRYMEKPYHVSGHILVDLDLTVWELRRYCQVLNVFGKTLPAQEQKLLATALANLARSDGEPRYKFRIHGGFIEEVLKKPKHPARSALLWNNATFASRKRATVSVRDHLMGGNPLLYLYPEMLDELLKYVPLPRELEKAYRAHLAAITADPSVRP